jgi:putative flippase GtrA
MENETQKPKSNWTKFVEAILGTFQDKEGKGSATRMTIFTCLFAMLYIMIVDQWFSKPANMKIFDWWAMILIAGLGLAGPVVYILNALANIIISTKGGKTIENKTEEPK